MAQNVVSLFSEFGLALVVLSVLLDVIGLPVPALPTLILAGALAVTGLGSARYIFDGR
jgi:membrane protein DedA with SNARE-associated domain